MIRTATHEDMPVLVDLARELVEEGRFAPFGFIPEKVRATFEKLIDGAGVIFVAERAGEIVGGMACGMSSDWFSDVPITYELGLFIRAERRGGFTAAMLIVAYLEWANSLGSLVNINAGVTSGIHQERTVEIYERVGRRLGINMRAMGVVISNQG